MLEIQSPISALRFLILYYIWSVRCKRSAKFLIIWFRHYYTIFWYQNILGYHKRKNHPCLCVDRSYDYHFFRKDFKVKQMVGVYSHQSHDWPRVYFVLFSLNSWVPKFYRQSSSRDFTDSLRRSLKQEASPVSYRQSYFPLCTMLYLETGVYNCSRNNYYALIMVCIYSYWFVFQMLCYLIYVIRSAVRFVFFVFLLF